MPGFAGFQAKDFADSIAGTSWRNRKALGGLLGSMLDAERGRDYQSWGVRRRPEVHLAEKERYSFDHPIRYAKLFVYTHGKLGFGFYVEASHRPEEYGLHGQWYRFRERLRTDQRMQQALEEAMAHHGLTMADYYRVDHHDVKKRGGALRGEFTFRDGRLQWRQRRPDSSPWQDATFNDLVARVAELPRDEWVDLHVYKAVARDDAIAAGAEVVDMILPVLGSLAPIYEMSID